MDKNEIKELDFNEVYLSVRSYNIVKLVSAMRPEIKKFIDLRKLTPDDLLAVRNCGQKTVREVQEVLESYGLSLKNSKSAVVPRTKNIYRCRTCLARFTQKYLAQTHCPPMHYIECSDCGKEYRSKKEAERCSVKCQKRNNRK